MADNVQVSDIAWARAFKTTTLDYMRQEESEILRSRPLGAMLSSRGRISYDHGGAGFQWQVWYNLHDTSGNDGTQPLVFQQTNLWELERLGWRGIYATDAIKEGEKLQNRGRAALVKVASGLARRLKVSVKEAFAEQPYIDGNATGNERQYCGIETFLGANNPTNADTVNVTDGTQRTNGNAADLFAWPNDTYGVLTTQLGDYGGVQRSGVWPDGQADPRYDFYTPVLQNYVSSSLNGAANTWAEQCVESIRLGRIQLERNSVDPEDGPDCCLLPRDLYRPLLNKLDPKERQMVSDTDKEGNFGFRNMVYIDGLKVFMDYGVPAAVGYLFNIDKMEVLSQYSDLFEIKGPVYDIDSQSDKVACLTLGNFKFESPRHFGKLADYTT